MSFTCSSFLRVLNVDVFTIEQIQRVFDAGRWVLAQVLPQSFLLQEQLAGSAHSCLFFD